MRACEAVSCSEDHTEWRCAASERAAGCRGHCEVARGGTRPRTTLRQGTGGSDRGIQRRAGRPPPGRSRRTDTWAGKILCAVARVKERFAWGGYGEVMSTLTP